MSRSKTNQVHSPKCFRAIPLIFALYFISGFTALLYQVAWQRMLGLFSGSDVRSVTIIVASYLLGLGLGNLLGGSASDRLSNEKFDIIEADAIQLWRSRAGMLYSQFCFDYSVLTIRLKL